MSSITELSDRLNRIKTEMEITKRKRDEEAYKIRKALDNISTEDVEILKNIVPGIVSIVKFSQEDIKCNQNRELDAIKEVRESLRVYLEKRLAYYEEKL